MSDTYRLLPKNHTVPHARTPIGPTHPWFPFISSTTADAIWDVESRRWFCANGCTRLYKHGGKHHIPEPDWHHDPRAWQH